MKRIFFAFYFCLFFTEGVTQQIKPLEIGDTLPPVMVQVMKSDGFYTVPLRNYYRDHFLILDLWATWCGACIKAMQQSDPLIRKYKGKLNVLPITYEDSLTVQLFKARSKVLKGFDFDFAVNDTVLMGGLFKFKVLPHQVWIDRQGVVKAITYPDEVTEENINQFINNEVLQLPEKTDDLDFDLTKPLTVDLKHILYRSVLTPYRAGLGNIMGNSSPAYVSGIRINRFYAINQYVLPLFYAAYSQGNGLVRYDRIELHTKDSFGLMPLMTKGTLTRKKLIAASYCYELLLPDKIDKGRFYTYLLEDLNRLFPYKAAIEKRMKTCWVLIAIDSSKHPQRSFSKAQLKWEGGFLKQLYHQEMSTLVNYLNWNMNLVVLDETDFVLPFDMKVAFKAGAGESGFELEVESVRNSLQKYGFDLVQRERMADVLVVRDRFVN